MKKFVELNPKFKSCKICGSYEVVDSCDNRIGMFLQRAFQGGFTHANMVNAHMSDTSSFDFTSSYSTGTDMI